jgi:F-type H+-transporting ATPase subunit beta
MTQPFFTTEQFTGIKGKLVSLQDSLDGCERILHDDFESQPENALYMIGPIQEAKTKDKAKNQSQPQPVAAHES